MTQVPGAMHLTEPSGLPDIPPVLRSYRGIFLWFLRQSDIVAEAQTAVLYLCVPLQGYKSIDNAWTKGKH